MLDSSWVTDTVVDRGRYGLMKYSVPEQRLTFLIAVTEAGADMTVHIARTFLSAAPALSTVMYMYKMFNFYQRVSIASYANRWYSQSRDVRPSVRPSVTLRYCIKTKKASVMISSPSESQNILVSRNIWFVTKFDWGHPERGRFLKLGWVRTGDFGDFSTNKPPYLRNGAR